MTHAKAFHNAYEESHAENDYHMEIFCHVRDPDLPRITSYNVGQVFQVASERLEGSGLNSFAPL